MHYVSHNLNSLEGVYWGEGDYTGTILELFR